MPKEKKTDGLVRDLEQIRSLASRCIERINHDPLGPKVRKLSASPGLEAQPGKLDFDSHVRAFVKSHARGLGGSQKFVLLLAYLTKGQVGREVELKAVQKQWNKMTSSSLLGGDFNRFYTNAAKERGWVNSPKQGFYVLRPSWRDIFEGK